MKETKAITLENIKLYRMTHIDNIQHIIQYGITHISSPNANPIYKSIGDVSLINHRKERCVVIDGKKYNISDYIPFYFGVRMPMLYVIQHGGNYVPQVTHATDIVYVVVSLASILQDVSLSYIFCDGHAMSNMTDFYGKESVVRLPKLIHWDDVRTRSWSGEDVPTSVKQYKQAEFLVLGDVGVQHIFKFICHDCMAKQKLLKLGILDSMVVEMPNAYY